MAGRQISVKGTTYKRLVEGLPRDRNGEVRRGALAAKMDALINAALDREVAKVEGKRN